MATNRISLKAPKGESVIETTKDMEEYFLKWLICHQSEFHKYQQF